MLNVTPGIACKKVDVQTLATASTFSRQNYSQLRYSALLHKYFKNVTQLT